MNEGGKQSSLYLEDLKNALAMAPDYRMAYRHFARVFKTFLDLNTEYATIRFGGTFAQTDYLLKSYNAPKALRQRVNETRIRLRRFNNGEVNPEELREKHRQDYETLCRFVALVTTDSTLSSADSTLSLTKSTLLSTKSTLSTDVEAQIAPPNHRDPIKKAADCLRFMVDSVTQDGVIGMVDGSDEPVTVSLSHCYNDDSALSWSYLLDYINPGTQLNLVRARQHNGVIFPEIIIYEPDYLVDITAVASCFESYGVSVLNYIVNKIKPSEHTEATLLGNLAGQILDEEITADGAERGYAETARKFFEDYALSLLAVKPDADFHKEARRQQQNIHRSFEELAKTKAGMSFEKADVMLEPSFISQMFGLQGRMDMLQLDHRFLVEQKSGKASFPEPTHQDEPPHPQQKHYIQMLLYMLLLRYNYAEQYERNNGFLISALLYSKYPTSLCVLSFAPKLVFEAMKMRNGIVNTEYSFASEGLEILGKLAPQDFKLQPVSGKLWLQYIEPQLFSLLNPIKNATPLERAYYFRMLRFISLEHLLSKIGNRRKEGSGFASVWLSTLEEKREVGNIIDQLKPPKPLSSSPRGGEGLKVTHLTLSFAYNPSKKSSPLRGELEGGFYSFNFRKGDIVILYPYKRGTIPDACRAMVFRCTIEDIAADGITLALRAPQSDERAFRWYGDCLWAIEHDYVESTFSGLYKGIHSFLSASKWRRELLLFGRQAELDGTVSLNGRYGDFDDLMLRVKRARDLFLIIGPPGTGKTSYGMLNTLKEELTNPQSNVVVMAYTNRAVDEICTKLLEEGIDFIRLGKSTSADPMFASKLMETRIRECRNLAELEHIIIGTRVIVATTTTLSASKSIFDLKHFDLGIIDEASQILEPHLLGILSMRHGEADAIRKIVMIGDHKQLPAVVAQNERDSEVTEPILRNIGLTNCRYSLFERLLRRYGDNPDVCYMLTKQGRMHRDIASFPNEMFYQGRLDVVPLPHQVEKEDGRVAFIDVPEPKEDEYVSDKVNIPEAKVIAEAVKEIYDKASMIVDDLSRISRKSRLSTMSTTLTEFDSNKTVGVIVPYRNQISAVRSILDSYNIPCLHDITIDTVERFQGSQRDFIIYGFTIQRPYQLRFLTENTFTDTDGRLIDRKLNVVMTRARKRLLLVGNAKLLKENAIFKKLIDRFA